MLMSRLRTTTDGRNAKIGLEFWNRIRKNCGFGSGWHPLVRWMNDDDNDDETKMMMMMMKTGNEEDDDDEDATHYILT